MSEVETWRPIEGYKGKYAASNLGRIKSLLFVNHVVTKSRSRILKPSLSSRGYPIASLCLNGKVRTVTIHKIIAETFHGPRPHPKMQCAHLDGNKSNSRADNLKWVTAKENESHKIMHGTKRKYK